MKKVIADLGETKILIDECVNGHGIWFDKGELYEIIRCSTENKDNPVLTFLRDMFCCETCNEEDKK
jgi:Zn-finger nucleic acid-binding protein